MGNCNCKNDQNQDFEYNNKLKNREKEKEGEKGEGNKGSSIEHIPADKVKVDELPDFLTVEAKKKLNE